MTKLQKAVQSVLKSATLLTLLSAGTAWSDPLSLQQSLYLVGPIDGIDSLPNGVQVNLYATVDAETPLASQTFNRGQYQVDFEFAHSDGVQFGQAARFQVDFTSTPEIADTLELLDTLWVEFSLDDVVAADRQELNQNAVVDYFTTQLDQGELSETTQIVLEESLVQLGYSFDQQSSESTTSASESGTTPDLFSPQHVAGSNGQVQFNNNAVQAGASNFYYSNSNGYVGIGTSSPNRLLHLDGNVAKFSRSVNSAGFIMEHTGGGVRLVFGQDVYSDGAHFTLKNLDTSPERLLMKVSVTAPQNAFILTSEGNVGIGTASPTHKMAVNGTIRAKELIVDTGWADYVFQEDYQLPSLSEVESYIQEHGHLPGMPSAQQVQSDGIGLGQAHAKLLEKVEELTLYLIELKKQNQQLADELAALKQQP